MTNSILRSAWIVWASVAATVASQVANEGDPPLGQRNAGPAVLARSPSETLELTRNAVVDHVTKCELRDVRNDARIWSHDFGFDVAGTTVADDGVVGVYGYTRGEHGVGFPSEDLGAFAVEILSGAGEELHRTRIDRCSTRVSHSIPFPYTKGHLLCEGENARTWIVRVASPLFSPNPGGESWWIYDLERGEFNGVTVPVPEPPSAHFAFIASVAAVRGHEIVAVLWTHTGVGLPTGAGDSLVLYGLDSEPGQQVLWSPQSVAATEGAPLLQVTWATELSSPERGRIGLITNAGTLRWKLETDANGWRAVRAD